MLTLSVGTGGSPSWKLYASRLKLHARLLSAESVQPAPDMRQFAQHLTSVFAPLFRNKLLDSSDSEQHRWAGSAFTLSVARQSNVIVVVTRAVKQNSLQGSIQGFAACAEQAATAAGYLFDANSRAQRGMTFI